MADLQPNIYAAVSITLFAALTALILRLKARRITKISLWYDDYFTVVAFVSTTRQPFRENQLITAEAFRDCILYHGFDLYEHRRQGSTRKPGLTKNIQGLSTIDLARPSTRPATTMNIFS